ncbi:hypothetical protein M3Y97_00174000 [Aphelenchoides bicaudatus]|nr:hypothetical protein M3Y97_00174000 [Aphelenchoides bicaudatus]
MAHQDLIDELKYPSENVYVSDDWNKQLIDYLEKDQKRQDNLRETFLDRDNRIQELTDESGDLKTKLRKLLGKDERSTAQLAEKDEQLKTFEIELKTKSFNLLSANKQLSELKELLQKEQQSRKMDQLSFNMVNSQVDALQSKNATLVASADGHKMNAKRLKLENEECQELVSRMLARINELEQKKDDTESEKVDDLEREVIEVNARLLCAEEDRDRVGTECKSLHECKVQLSIQNNELNRELEQLNRRIEKLEAKNAKLVNEHSSITNKIIDMVAENEALTEEKNCYIEQVRGVLDEMTTLKSKTEDLSDVCDEMKQKLEDSNKMYKELSRDYSTKQAEYDTLVLLTQQLQIENAELKSTKEEAQKQRRKSDHDYFESLFMQIKNDNLQFHQTNVELRDQNAQLKEKAHQAEIDYQELLKQNRQLEERQTVLERDQPELEARILELDEINMGLKTKKSERYHLLNQINELERDKADLQKQLNGYRSLANECMATDLKYQSPKESIDTMTSELESKTEQIEALKFAIGSCDKLYAKLQGEAVKLRNQSKFYESVNLFKRAIALEQATNNQPSTLAWLNYWTSKSYYLWRRYDEVVSFCNKSSSYLPDICAPVALRAKALYKLEKYEDAHRDLEQVLGKTADSQKVIEMIKACERKMRGL